MSTIRLSNLVILGLIATTAASPNRASAKDKTTATDSKIAKPQPLSASAGLSPLEREDVRELEQGFVTKLRSKQNPRDRYTWYVIGFVDVAASETQSVSIAPMTGPSSFVWSPRQNRQQKVVKQFVLVQGRAAAARAVYDSMNHASPALAELHARMPGTFEMQSPTQVAVNRLWAYQAFATEDAARRFLEKAQSPK